MDSAVLSRKVVIDAGAAIKLQRLERFGKELFTTSGVYAEVRDEKARALLLTLPVELKTREPLPQDMAYAKQFAKLTGDLGFLSTNDLSLIALTVLLHRESGGEKLRERPAALGSGEGTTAFDWAPAKPTKEEKAHGEENNGASSSSAAVAEKADSAAADGAKNASDEQTEKAPADNAAAVDHFSGAGKSVTREEIAAAVAEAEAADAAAAAAAEAAANDDGWTDVPKKKGARPVEPVEDDEESEDGDSAGEWVTTENLHRFGVDVAAQVELNVTCVSTDYSVQNVLLQMGITPLTFDGYAVRSVKLWGLVCRACYHFSRDTQKVFCAKCGNDTVVRVPIIVGPDGTPTVLNNGRKLRTKGTVFSMPKPQGGRGWKPIMAEDEIYIGGRDRQMRYTQGQGDKEKAAKDPFDVDNGARQWWQRPGAGGSAKAPGQGCGGLRMQAGYGRARGFNPNANNFKGFRGNKK